MGLCCGTLAYAETEIIINAPLADVWPVFTNWENQASWKKLFKITGGNITVGSQLEVMDITNNTLSRPRVLEFYFNKYKAQLRWVEKVGCGGLFDVQHYFICQPVIAVPEKTRFLHGKEYTGCITLLTLCCLDKLVLRHVREEYNELNSDFKKICEELYLQKSF